MDAAMGLRVPSKIFQRQFFSAATQRICQVPCGMPHLNLRTFLMGI